jgi:ribosome-interacting GTPase 1
MPANLPPQYFEAEKRFRAAKEPEDKIAALQEMLAIMPRHKGTDKLHALLRQKIARFSQEAERKFATARRTGFYISKEGAGQIMLVGPANAGKSQLLASLTEAIPEIAEYPFTTKTPVPGMMPFEDIQIQLVDTPPIGHKEVRVLLEARIEPLNDDTQVTPGSYTRKMMIVGNKNDLVGSNEHWERLSSQCARLFPLVSISAREGSGLEEFKRAIYQALNIIRVYTKTPGSKTDLTDPMILEKGSTLEEAAESLHKDFRQNLKYAVVWGSGKYDGQRVAKEHVLQDGDIVEFHI